MPIFRVYRSGVLKLFRIELKNAGPNKTRSKLSESIFLALRRFDNDPVFHQAQRSGPNDTPNPDPVPVDIELFERFVAKSIRDFNARTDRHAPAPRPVRPSLRG